MKLISLLFVPLLIFGALPQTSLQQQTGRVEVSTMDVKFEVTSTGFLMANTTVTFKAVDGSATIQNLLVEYPIRMLDQILKRVDEPLVYWKTNPQLLDASVRVDLAASQSRNRTIFELNPGSNRQLSADATLSFSFWTYLRDAVRVAESPANSYVLSTFQPSLGERVEKFEFGLIAPSGINPAPNSKFNSVTRLLGKAVHFNTTSGATLSEPRSKTLRINGTEASRISLLHIIQFERRIVLAENGALIVMETLVLENTAGGTLEFLPLTLPGGVTNFEVLPPPPPYPGFRTLVKIVEGKLDLNNITRAIKPGQKQELTYQYRASAQLFAAKSDALEIRLPMKLPTPGFADTAWVGLEARWVSFVPPKSTPIVSNFDDQAFTASIPIPLAGGASSVIGGGIIGFLAILVGALLLPQLSPGTVIRRRIPQLQRSVDQRLQKDRDFLENVGRFLKGEASTEALTKAASRLREERDALLSEWAELKPTLMTEKNLPMERLNAAERAYERAVADLSGMIEQLLRGTLAKEPFERQWQSMSRRVERQAHEVRDALKSLVSKIQEEKSEEKPSSSKK